MPSVVGTGERAAPLVQFGDGCRRLRAHGLDDAGVAEPVALAQRVGRVLLPRVLGVASADGSVDAARCEHGVGIEARPAADHDDLAPCVVRRDRRAADRRHRFRSRAPWPCASGSWDCRGTSAGVEKMQVAESGNRDVRPAAGAHSGESTAAPVSNATPRAACPCPRSAQNARVCCAHRKGQSHGAAALVRRVACSRWAR